MTFNLLAGKSHPIKEENYLLYGVVEEKAMKAETAKIEFEYWSMRKNIMHDLRTNAATALRNVWKAYYARKLAAEKRALKARNRAARLASQKGLLSNVESLEAEVSQAVHALADETAQQDISPALSMSIAPGTQLRVDVDNLDGEDAEQGVKDADEESFVGGNASPKGGIAPLLTLVEEADKPPGKAGKKKGKSSSPKKKVKKSKA